MAEVTLTLKHDRKTGRRTLVVHFESEEDALPMEHERDHRAFVEGLLGVPLGEVADDIEIERAGRGVAEAGEEAQVARERQGESR